MAKSTRQRLFEPNRPKPVEEIAVSEKHLKLRTVLMILCLALGLAGITYGVYSYFGGEPGWVEIKASNNGQTSCSGDFVFYYRLGDTGAGTEKRAVTSLYTQTAVYAYRIFTAHEEFEDYPNLASLNAHPNETVKIQPALWYALKALQDAGDRSIFLGPVYERYGDLFFCTEDVETVDFDPYENPEVAEEYRQAALWAQNSEAVDIELSNDGACLKISPEYEAWAKENGVRTYIDLGWMQNAFIADYLAEVFMEKGYTHGSFSSYDGFTRNLDGSGEEYALTVYDRIGQSLYPAAVVEYSGPAALVNFRDFPLIDRDERNYYKYADGTLRGPYVDQKDGLSKSAAPSLLCCAAGGDETCAGLLLKAAPIYVAQELQESRIRALADEGVSSVYCADKAVICTGTGLKIDKLYSDGQVEYRLSTEG